jgi:1,4-dihydroxy-2-naphthoate octaprenyltransferase
VNPLRAFAAKNNWLFSKVPMAFGYCYLGLLVAPGEVGNKAALHLATMLFVFLGSGLFVRYFNDFCDIDQDRKAGKQNIARGDHSAIRWLKLSGYTAIIPVALWFSAAPFPLYLLMGVQHLLYLLYSIPPIRLKEKGWSGLVCDAAYGHAVPAAVGFAFGYTAGAKSSPESLWMHIAFAVLSQFALGIINILYHQIEDHPKDKKAGVLTWVALKTPATALKIGFNRYAPLALASLGGFYLYWGINGFPVLALALLLTLFLISAAWFSNTANPPARHSPRLLALNELTEIWAPLYTITALVFQDHRFIYLLLLHTFMFYRIIFPFVFYYFRRLGSGLQWLSGQLVYFYYHKLLVLYARLKKRFFS